MATAKKSKQAAASTKRSKNTNAGTAKQRQAVARARAAAHREVYRPILRPDKPHDPATIIGPDQYTDQLGQELFQLVAMGIHIKSIALMERMPKEFTMWQWVARPDHPFSKLYDEARAMLVRKREEYIESVAENTETLVVRKVIKEKKQVLDIDGNIVDVETEREEFIHQDATKHRELLIKTMQWSLGHLAPKKHGPKAQAVEGGSNPQLDALFASLNAGPVD